MSFKRSSYEHHHYSIFFLFLSGTEFPFSDGHFTFHTASLSHGTGGMGTLCTVKVKVLELQNQAQDTDPSVDIIINNLDENIHLVLMRNVNNFLFQSQAYLPNVDELIVTSDADTGGKVSLALHLDNVQHHPVGRDSTRTSGTWSGAAPGMSGAPHNLTRLFQNPSCAKSDRDG